MSTHRPQHGHGHQPQHHHGHHHHHHPHQHPLVPSSAASDAGRLKTEQVVLEFLFKAAELVLQSRINFPTDDTTDHRRGTRRARFNLDIDELPSVRQSMAAWRDAIHQPLAIRIYYTDTDSNNRVLLEHWSITYAPDYSPNRSNRPANGHTDVIQHLKDVCKQISVLLRALFSYLRLLPAHRLVRHARASHLTYELDAETSNRFNPHLQTSRYRFNPIPTPFGVLDVSVTYRQQLEQLHQHDHATQPALFHPESLIQDYVPRSPELFAQHLSNESDRGDEALPQRPRAATTTAAVSSAVSTAQRRRSSPVQTTRPTPTLSRPMAIPQANAPLNALYTDADDDDLIDDKRSRRMLTSPRALVSPRTTKGTTGLLHAHSFGDSERLRTMAANPNVTAAPYGYNNVAIEHSPSHWGGISGATGVDATGASGSSGNVATSLQDEASAAYFPRSTPPRHPNSLLSGKPIGRLNPATPAAAATSNLRRAATANDVMHARTLNSLENFSLDGDARLTNRNDTAATTNAPLRVERTTMFSNDRMTPLALRRTDAISDALAADDSAMRSRERLTPPFTYAAAPGTNDLSHSALVVHRQRPSNESHASTSRTFNVPLFANSPPFHANPTELLSTSPAYSYSKHLLQTHQRRSPRSVVPMVVTTDPLYVAGGGNRHVKPALRLEADAAAAATATATDAVGYARAFASDQLDLHNAHAWGVASPDSPDAFGLALTGTTNKSAGRQRYTAFAASATSSSGNDDASVDIDSIAAALSIDRSSLDWSDSSLPFALGDDLHHGDLSDATTAASTAGSETSPTARTTSHSSATSSRSGAQYDTASIGSFLHQLKHAPRLQMFADRALQSSSTASREQLRTEHDDTTQAHTDAIKSIDAAAADRSTQLPVGTEMLFEDELARFRSLRDELARDL